MTSIQLSVHEAFAKVTNSVILTAGMVGLPVSIEYDQSWNGLNKSAVFSDGVISKARLGVENVTTVPWEVMTAGRLLRIGVEGRNSDGTLVMPTVWADVGRIRPSASVDADPSADPALPVWAQLEAQIGDLSQLETKDKSSLVAAINEAAKTGNSPDGIQILSMIGDLSQLETDAKSDLVAAINEAAKTGDIGLAGFSPLATVKKSVNGNTVITITDVNGTTTAVVTDGYTPVKGEDYWTDADKAEIKGYVDEAILGGAW